MPFFEAVRVISADNVNEALSSGLWALKVRSIVNDSRNGRVIVSPSPVVTSYQHPEQRVLFSELRDANPFFHLFESIWMMAGRNDVAKVAVYAKQMDSFAEDDGLQWGAYGYRWREFFHFDQLPVLLELLRTDPKTRRAVLTMWSPDGDLVPREVVSGIGGPPTAVRGGQQSKDIPCNTHIYFDLTTGVLNMSVLNRSNDAIWGAYGANAVHMSFLQEFMARQLGVRVGTYHQFSNNFHIYADRPDVQRLFYAPPDEPDQWMVHYQPRNLYRTGSVDHYPIVRKAGTAGEWMLAADEFCDLWGEDVDWIDPFFSEVAAPMMQAHALYKRGLPEQAIKRLCECSADDWRIAGMEWIERRMVKMMEGKA